MDKKGLYPAQKKVLDFLREHSGDEFTIHEIRARVLTLKNSSLEWPLNDLVKKGLVVKGNKKGVFYLYSFS